jgi:hypothetical protein
MSFFSVAAPRVDTTAVAEMLGWDGKLGGKAGVSGSKSRKHKMSAMPEKKTGAPPLPHRCSSALSSIMNSERREIFIDVEDGGGAGGGYGGDAARCSSDGSLGGGPDFGGHEAVSRRPPPPIAAVTPWRRHPAAE